MNGNNRGGPSSAMLIAIGLITICLLSAYATATWPFAMREGYRWDPKEMYRPYRGAPGRVSTGVIRDPYKPGGGKPGTGGRVRTQPYKRPSKKR